MFNLRQALTIKPIADFCAKAPAPEKVEELYDDKGRHLMVESVTLDDIERTYFDDMDTDEHGAMMLEAITTSKMRLERTMSAFVKALNQQLQGTNLQAGAPELGRVRKTGGVAIMPAVMSLSDGQSITVMFHSPTNDPSKISTDDTLVAFRFLLNKRDVTHVVSPDGGKDISLKQTCLSLANLAEKNTAKFQAAQERANKLKADLENYRAQAAQLDEQAAQLIDQGDKLKAKEDSNQAELATITAKADKQEQLNNELRKQLEAAQAKAKAASEGTATPPAATSNGEASKTLQLAKKAIQEAYSHQKSADKITATIERRGESARLTFNRNSYYTMRTKALSQAEELFTKYVQQGGTAADWDAGVPEEMEGVASYEFMLAKTGAQPAAQPAGTTTPPAGTGDDGAITAGKPIQRLVTRDEYIAILGDKVDSVSRTGWTLYAGKGSYAGQFVLDGGNDGQHKVVAVGFTSQDEAIQWAKENRRNKVGLDKQLAKRTNFPKMIAAAESAYGRASGKNLTADAVIDSKADAEQQDKQRAAFIHLISDAAKSILAYASSQGIPLTSSVSNVCARHLVVSALGVTADIDALPDTASVDINVEPNEKLVFDGSALVNGKVSVDEFIRVLKSYGGRYVEKAEEEATQPAKYYYGLRARPASSGSVPADGLSETISADDFTRMKGGNYRAEDMRHGVAVYDRQLTAEEISKFELVDLNTASSALEGEYDRTAARELEKEAISKLIPISKGASNDPLPNGYTITRDITGRLVGKREYKGTVINMPCIAVSNGVGDIKITPYYTPTMGDHFVGLSDVTLDKEFMMGDEWARVKRVILERLPLPEEKSAKLSEEQLLADAEEYLRGATLPADIKTQAPEDYILSKMKEEFEGQKDHFLGYAEAIGSTSGVLALYAQFTGNISSDKTLAEWKSLAIGQYIDKVDNLPRDTEFSKEMMRGAVNHPEVEPSVKGWARQFFNWDENLSSKTVMDATDSVLASLVKDNATAKIKELIADVAKETLPDGLHKMANSAGDIADAQSINGVSVKMPSLTFAYDTTGKPSKSEFKKSGVIVSPDFNEAGKATGYRVTHNGSTQVFNSWEGMKETVFKLAGVPENKEPETVSDNGGDDANAKAVTDAVSALERIRDSNVANMSLQEVNDAAAEIERLINTLMELGAYTENESLAEAATQPLVDRMMELAA